MDAFGGVASGVLAVLAEAETSLVCPALSSSPNSAPNTARPRKAISPHFKNDLMWISS